MQDFAGRIGKNRSISSLEKLTQKIRENRGEIEEEKKESKTKPIIQKRFIGEVT
jgi:hypothetical protein